MGRHSEEDFWDQVADATLAGKVRQSFYMLSSRSEASDTLLVQNVFRVPSSMCPVVSSLEARRGALNWTERL